jgi:hypothetical protein
MRARPSSILLLGFERKHLVTRWDKSRTGKKKELRNTAVEQQSLLLFRRSG